MRRSVAFLGPLNPSIGPYKLTDSVFILLRASLPYGCKTVLYIKALRCPFKGDKSCDQKRASSRDLTHGKPFFYF
jgi:hypothetical protein